MGTLKNFFKGFFTHKEREPLPSMGLAITRKPEAHELRYVSEAKLTGLQAALEKRGFGLGFSPTSFSLTAGKTTISEQIAAITKQLDAANILTEEDIPRANEYLLVRFFGKAGTAWGAFESNTQQFQNLAWWVGRSKSMNFLGYGNISHLTNQGQVPDLSEGSTPTWWPSITSSYQKLMEDVAKRVNSPQSTPLPLESINVTDFFDYVFNDGVERGHGYTSKSVYEALLRVDKVDENSLGEVTVLGSPVWVAEVKDYVVVPGTYTFASAKNCADCSQAATYSYARGGVYANSPRTIPCHRHKYLRQGQEREQVSLEGAPRRPQRNGLVSLDEDYEKSEPVFLRTLRSRLNPSQ